MKKIFNKYKDLGLEIGSEKNTNLELRISAPFIDKKGDLDYKEYVKTQQEINKKKIAFSGPSTQYLKSFIPDIKQIPNLHFGICHGTRRGDEQKIFSNLLGINVIGTEISETALSFPNTIQWDFHNLKKEWENKVCFIFSNSIDHSYDPIFCLSQWMKCIKPQGAIYIQRGNDDLPKSFLKRPDKEFPADIFQSSHEIFRDVIVKEASKICGKKYRIKEINFGSKFTLIIKILN